MNGKMSALVVKSLEVILEEKLEKSEIQSRHNKSLCTYNSMQRYRKYHVWVMKKSIGILILQTDE